MIQGKNVFINGDGETSRDFCFIKNVVQMNILAATASESAKDQVYNVAVGDRTSLNDLYSSIKTTLASFNVQVSNDPIYQDFRSGDVRHSQADITKAKDLLNYSPEFNIVKGIEAAMPWYIEKLI